VLGVVLVKEEELNFGSERQPGRNDLSALQNPMDMRCQPGMFGRIKVGMIERHAMILTLLGNSCGMRILGRLT